MADHGFVDPSLEIMFHQFTQDFKVDFWASDQGWLPFEYQLLSTGSCEVVLPEA